jgi:hypothetical protein
MSVAHEAHQGWQRDAGPHHVRAEGVPTMLHEA